MGPTSTRTTQGRLPRLTQAPAPAAPHTRTPDEPAASFSYCWRITSSPAKSVLIVNPRSGGGKAVRFDLVAQCRTRRIEPILFEPGDDLTTVATAAVQAGAEVLGMAGGDGSQAAVAAVAVEHDLPYVCVPAGTRNHFALDLSAFVMIGQNRQAEFQRAKADHDYSAQEQELRLNTELTRETHTLTTELHGRVLGTLASQVEAHDVPRVAPLPEPSQQLMLVGPWDRRATAHSFGARLSGVTRSVEKAGSRPHGR